MSRELLQMVFDAMSYGNAQDRESARLAVKAALAEQPALMIRGDIRDGLVDDEPAQQQEPVECANGCRGFFKHHPPAQRTWVGLTDESIVHMMPKPVLLSANVERWDRAGLLAFARAIEAKLKEKNNGLA